MSNWPVHAKISGPVVMIGFGSIGRGTLPLLERHFKFDKKRLVVLDPSDANRRLLDERGIRFLQVGLTEKNYEKVLAPLLKDGPGRAFCVNLSVDVCSLDVMKLCRRLSWRPVSAAHRCARARAACRRSIASSPCSSFYNK